MSEEEKGREVLQLNPYTYFLCNEVSPIRVQIWLDAWVRTTDLYDGIRLPLKTKVYNKDRKIMGRVVQDFNPLKIMEETDSMTHLVISGYLEKSCLDNTFNPEEELSRILDKAQNNERIETFKPYMMRYGLTMAHESPLYTSFLMVQPDFVRQTMEPRLLIVFYRNELIAIFHTRPVKVKRYDSIEMGKQYKMIYNSKFSEHTKREMVEIYKRKLG